MAIRRPDRRLLLVALAVYSAALGVALLAPRSGTQSEMASWVRDLGRDMGLPTRVSTQGRAEFLCNALILAPLSLLGSLVWPRTTWREWTAYAFVIAVAVELTQGLLLPHRTASNTDIVANTLGGLLGAVLALLVRSALRAQSARRALGEAPPARG